VADAVAMIVVSAGVAPIVLSAALAWNGWRERLNRVSLQQMQESHQATLHDLDRRHQAHLQNLDRRHEIALRDVDRRQEVAMRDLHRKHETRLHELADLRALRDLKVERLRTNLLAVIDAALKFGDREFDLRMRPRRFADPAPAVDQARKRLNDLRPVLILDTESERLLRAVADLVREYDTYVITLRRWQGLTETTRPPMTTGPETPSVTGDQEALQQAQKRGDSLAKWVQVIAAEHPHIEVALDHAVARRLCESLELRAVVYDRGRLHPEQASRRDRPQEASQLSRAP